MYKYSHQEAVYFCILFSAFALYFSLGFGESHILQGIFDCCFLKDIHRCKSRFEFTICSDEEEILILGQKIIGKFIIAT